jgi:hypothetical protein
MPTSISSIVCSDNLRTREKSCLGRFTQAGKSAVIERIAWCSAVRTALFLVHRYIGLRRGGIFKLKSGSGSDLGPAYFSTVS